MKPQVSNEHYYSSDYFDIERFVSYSYQIREILRLEPRRILEIGIGNGLVSHLLRSIGKSVVTVDFDSRLNPDIVCSVTDIPLPAEYFDIVACFEVLEHIPFELFYRSVSELCRVSSKYVIMSLPDVSRFYKIEFNLPIIGHHRYSFELRRNNLPSHTFDGEHYWEIGKRGYHLDYITETIQSCGLKISKTFKAWENPYHRFFITQKIKHNVKELHKT